MDPLEHSQAIKAIKRARDLAGGTVALAGLLDVSPTTVSEWIVGKRKVPIMQCPLIERATERQVTREELRPDLDWSIFRDNAPQESRRPAA